MSFVGKAKEALGENLEKAKDLIGESIDKVEDAVDRVGYFVEDGDNGEGVFGMDFPWAEIYPYLVRNKTVVRGILGTVVATQGSGPYAERAFDYFLANCGIELRNISGDEPPDVVVLGTHDWSEEDLNELQESCFGDIRVYSQQMVLASMAIGTDIFDFDEEGETIFDFIMGHPALEYFHKDGVMVPGLAKDVEDEEPTQAEQEPVETLRVEFESDGEWPEVGPLGDLGYRVGKARGLPRHQRREILFRCFRIQLISTSTWTAEYISDWGQRCTEHRWERMCRALEWSITKAERRTSQDMSVAIAEWEEDLRFLRENKLDWLTHSH